MDKKDTDIAGLEIQLKIYSKKIAQLEKEKEGLLAVIKDNGLEDEVNFNVSISDEEYICTNEIKKLRDASDIRPLDKLEVSNLDIMHKILRTIRTGKDPAKSKAKKMDVAELLKIVDNE